jgi:hypothetical protein
MGANNEAGRYSAGENLLGPCIRNERKFERRP